MKTKLDIQKVIEKAEQIAYDGKIQGASMASLPVQILEIDNGQKYQFSVGMTLIQNEDVSIVKNMNKTIVSGSCFYTETELKRAFIEGYKSFMDNNDFKYNSLSERAAKEQADNWFEDKNNLR